jgi:hypothetical protein
MKSIKDIDLYRIGKFLCTPSYVVRKNLLLLRRYGIISDNEMKYYRWVQSNFDMNSSHFQKGQNYDPNMAVSELKNMTDEKKSAFCKILRTMGNIDGNPFEATKEAVEHIIVKARLLGSLKKYPNPF